MSALDQVITISEVCELYPHLKKDTVIKHCTRGKLVAKKSGGIWLTERKFADAKYGKK